MRIAMLSTAVIAGFIWIGISQANAAPPAVPGTTETNIHSATVKKIGYWRRYHRRYGYPVPFAYYPPAYGYNAPPRAYAYPPPSDYAPPSGGDYADAPPPEAQYGSAPPSGDEYSDESNYGDALPPEEDNASAPPPQSY